MRNLQVPFHDRGQGGAIDLKEYRLHRAQSESDASAGLPLVNVPKKVELNSVPGAFYTEQD